MTLRGRQIVVPCACTPGGNAPGVEGAMAAARGRVGGKWGQGGGGAAEGSPAIVMYRGTIGNLVQSVTGRGRPSISKTLKDST